MNDAFVNHYRILRVSRTASKEQIEKAYAKYIAQAKADEKGDPGDAMIRSGMSEDDVTQMFLARIAQLTQSYEILSNSTLRAQYDDEYDAEMRQRTSFDWDEKDPGHPAAWLSAPPTVQKTKFGNELGWPAYALERPIWWLLVLAFALLLYGQVNGAFTVPGINVREIYPGGALMFLICLLIMSGTAKWTVHKMRLKEDLGPAFVVMFGLAAALTVLWADALPRFNVTSMVTVGLAAPVITFLLFLNRVRHRTTNQITAVNIFADILVFMFAATLNANLTPHTQLEAWVSNWAFIALVFRF